MEEERILTLHPLGKKGVNVVRKRYDQVREAMIQVLAQEGEMSFSEMNDRLIARLAGTFDAKITWYVVTVKLDLEARGILERVPDSSPQVIRLAKG